MSRRPSKPRAKSATERSAEELASAAHLFQSLLGSAEDPISLDAEGRLNSRMVYTNGVTLWMLILQRLGGGKSLSEVVSHLLAYDRELLPQNKRVREKTLSENSGGYARARKRLSLDYIHDFSERVCNYLGEISEPVVAGRRVFLIDGTTITLPPTKALKDAYPPAPNQYGESVWPVAQLMLANEMQSGCAMLPQIDPMYGENNASEAVQAHRIVKQLPAHSIVMADSAFGIFSVAYHSLTAGHDFLFRLSHTRFKAHQRRADLLDEDPFHKTYRLRWTPSGKERKSNPDLPADASLDVVLHEVQIGTEEPLYLVSSLDWDGHSASSLYCRRYDVEFDIRDFKVTLDSENIRAKSVEMFKKELHTSIVAYNLVAQFRRQAATLAGIKPRRLSFKGVWTTMKNRLLMQPACSMEEWLKRFEDGLQRAGKRKHPNRSKPRSYPRQSHTRRQKSTNFMKAQAADRKKARDQAKQLK
jgi:hypothetical protein